MRKVSEFLIQDRDNNLLAVLDPQECYDCVKDQTVNADNTLELVLDVSHYAAQFLKKDNRIMYLDNIKNKWHEYVMSGIEQQGYKITVNAESSLYDTLSNWIDFIDITGNTVVTGLQKIFNTCSPKSNWNAGTSDITGNYQMQRTRYTLKEVIFAWANKVSGELEERIVIYNNKPTRYVDIKQSIGSNKGKVLYDDRDLTDINIEVPVDTIYTMAYGYGKSETVEGTEESKPITFKDIVWTVAGGDPVDKPAGQEWVALPDEYKQKYGYYDTNGILQHRATGYEESGVEVPSELLQRTYDFLLKNVQDQSIYKLTAADYRALNLNPIEISLGDIIGARIVKLGDIYISSKVLRYKEDLKNPDNNDFELENNAKSISNDIINNERQITDLKDRIDRIGDIVFTQNILDKWNQEINAESGYLLVGSPQDGLAVYNASTIVASTKAVQLKGGSIRIANTKTSGQFNWSTVMTGDGIIANAIYTGLLAGNMFDLDLDSGIVKMGKRNASGVIDAPALQLNADGSISMKIGGADLNTTITNINNTVGDLNTSVDNVVQEVEKIDIGGTNLLKNTGLDKDLNGYIARGSYAVLTRDTENKYNDNNSLKIVASVPAIDISKDIVNYTYANGVAGENLVVSFYVKGTPGTAWIRAGYSGAPKKQFNVTANWKKIEIDLGIVSSVGVMNAIVYGFNIAGTFYINSMKMEYGTKPTTWSPAPQDTTGRLVVVEQDVVIAQNNIVSLQTGLNGIQADVGQITTTLTTLKSSGTNLIKNSALVDGWAHWTYSAPTGSQVQRYQMSDEEMKLMGPPTGLDTIIMIMSQNIDITTNKYIYFYQPSNKPIKGKANQEYVMSCWYYVPSNGDINNHVYMSVNQLNAAGSNIRTVTKVFSDYTVNQWHYTELKFTTVDNVELLQTIFAVLNRQIVYFSSMYLGEGNISPGWSPNANDVNKEIYTTKTDLAQLHIETDNITQRVTKVEKQEIGVANVLKDSGEVKSNSDYLLATYGWYGVKPNTTYTIVMNGFTSVATKKIDVWFNGGAAHGGYFPVTTTAKTMIIKVTTPATLTQQHISFYNDPSSVAGTGTINWVAMYEGDVKPPLTWTAAPQELAKISYVEQKTTAEALTTTISSGLASGSQIKTAKYVMDANGFTIFNAAFTMYDGVNTNSNRVLYFDSSDASFAFVGKTLQYHNNGNIGLKIFESVIELYSKQTPDSRTGQIFASYTNDDRLVIGADVGNKIYLSTQATAGSQTYNAKFGVTENYSVSYIPFYFALVQGHESYMVNTTTGSKIQFANGMNFEINSTSKVFLRFNSTTNILDCGQDFKFGMGFYNSQGTYSAVPVGSDNCQRVRMVTGSNNYLELNTTSGIWGVTAWSSDGRMKKNIAVSEVDATQLINKIKIRQFDWKDIEKHQDVGIIAQELKEVKDDLVFAVGNEERLQIDTANVVALLIKSLQEQIERNDKIERKLNYLYENLGITQPVRRMARMATIEEEIAQYEDMEPIIVPDYENIVSDMVPSEEEIVIVEA